LNSTEIQSEITNYGKLTTTIRQDFREKGPTKAVD